MTSAAEKIAGNDDILSEILVRLPAKSLVGFKCVSKHWISLISNPSFSLRHTLLQDPNNGCRPSGIFIFWLRAMEFVKTKFQFSPITSSSSSSIITAKSSPFKSLNFAADDRAGLKILQSCNGLLLCSSDRFRVTSTLPLNYYVYNPTTNQYSILPPPPNNRTAESSSPSDSSSYLGVNLAFDPSKSPHYKVICIQTASDYVYKHQTYICRDICVYIYSSETHSWSSSGGTLRSSYDVIFSDGVFFNGSVHWISPKGFSMLFNVESEIMAIMPGAPPLDIQRIGSENRYFGESNGHLHLIQLDGYDGNTFLRVLEMERDYSRWFERYRIDISLTVFLEPNLNLLKSSVLGLVRYDDEKDSSLLLHLSGKVISYNFEDESFFRLLKLPPDSMDDLLYFRVKGFMYIDSLACV